MTLPILIVITCLAMIAKDGAGTLLGVAQARGNKRLSARFDPIGTLAGVAFFSYGATSLTHGHSWVGWLGLLPVLVIDVIDGWYWTAVADHIQSDDNADGTDLPGIWRAMRIEAGVLARAWASWIRRRFTRKTDPQEEPA